MGRRKKQNVQEDHETIKRGYPKQAERLKEVRRENGLTQSRLGAIVGVEQKAISKYETLENRIPADIAETIGKMFNIRPSWLLGWDDWKTADDEYTKYMIGKTFDSMHQAEMLLLALGIDFQPGEVRQIPRSYIAEDTGERRQFLDDDRDDPNAYLIIKDGVEVGHCSINEYSRLIDAITDFADNEAKKLIDLIQKKRSVDNG